MNGCAVRCESVRKRYGSKWALRDFSVAIPERRITAVLGPNGAGKSTFFRMLCGITRPDAGRVEVLGRTPGWRTNRDIAYLPDRARWYGDLSVGDSFVWAERLLPEFDKERAEQLAAYMGLDPGMKAEGMSRGEEARLMLVLCAARRVPLIVLDEPFAGIDLISRERIVSTLIDILSSREQTVLISTHEISETESLFDYVVFVDNGQVALAGDAERIRAERGSMEQVYRQLYR